VTTAWLARDRRPGTARLVLVALDQCSPQTLTGADGAQLIACAHGGHVVGWTPAGGRPRLWLSPTAECGPGAAIRGGIPVIFPQFAGRGPLPKHGVARNRGWQVQPASSDTGAALWQAKLTNDPQTRAIWPHRFELTLTARAEADRLETTLEVHNPGDVEWTFTAALHTYLTLGDPAAVIHGLGGRTAEDNAAAGRPTTLGVAGEALAATQPRDVAVTAVGEPLTLDDPVLGRLVLTAEGFGDRVVWNPGPGHGLADVPDGDEQRFVCIEPAALTPVLVKPASIWTGRQTLVAKPMIFSRQ
jgi:glucose-6-phosphate 1-epimerase